MKKFQDGFTALEMLVACALIGIIGTAAGMTIFRIIQSNDLNNNYVTVVSQVETAGNWISRDVQSADTISVDGLTGQDFIVLSWVQANLTGGSNIQHTETYYFDNVSNNIGDLERLDSSSDGTNQTTLIASHIYFNPADTAATSMATYAAPALTVKLTSISGGSTENKIYTIQQRPNYTY